MPTYTTEGGLNLSKHPSLLADNELSMAYNVIYSPESGKLVTRGGLSLWDAELPPLSEPIQLLYTHVRKRGEAWLIAVSNSGVYTLDMDGVKWDLLSVVETEIPSMISFNGSLIIADGSDQGLLKWDGTTLSRIADSPQASIVYTLKNRVICNSVADGDGELDAVYFSGVEDETDWDISGTSAAAIRAGYGDGMEVNGFSNLYDTLVISKQAIVDEKVVKKQMFGLDMSGAQSEWSADPLSGHNAAVNSRSMVPIYQDVIYVDTEGFERLVPTINYGDIQNDPTSGGKINSLLQKFVQQADDVRVIEMPELSAIWIIAYQVGKSHKMLCFSKLTQAFTEIQYSTNLRTAAQYGDKTFVAGDSGYLYYLDDTATDSIAPDTDINFTSVTRFKMALGEGDIRFEKGVSQIDYIEAGTLLMEAYNGANNSKAELAREDFLPGNANMELFEANDDLYDATYFLAGTLENKILRNKFRGAGITLQVRTLSGRVGINLLSATFKQVGP